MIQISKLMKAVIIFQDNKNCGSTKKKIKPPLTFVFLENLPHFFPQDLVLILSCKYSVEQFEQFIYKWISKRVTSITSASDPGGAPPYENTAQPQDPTLHHKIHLSPLLAAPAASIMELRHHRGCAAAPAPTAPPPHSLGLHGEPGIKYKARMSSLQHPRRIQEEGICQNSINTYMAPVPGAS